MTTVVKKLYEDYTAGILDGLNYRNLLREYQAEQKTLNDRLTAINVQQSKAGDYESNFRKLKAFAASYADCTELTAEMLNRLVERIEIEPARTVDGKKTQQINIVYRFIKSNL